jgi:hypothetical protein
VQISVVSVKQNLHYYEKTWCLPTENDNGDITHERGLNSQL